MADINHILANLTRSAAGSSQHARESSSSSYPYGTAAPSNQSTHYQPPTVSSPIFTPPPTTEHRGRDGLTSNPILGTASPAPEQASMDRKNNLLNLLKFNQPSSQTSTPHQPDLPAIPSTLNPSAASTRGGGLASLSPQPPSPAETNPQDQLLRLLNQSQALKTTAPPATTLNPFLKANDDSALADVPIKREETPVRAFGIQGSTPSPFRPPETANKSTVFTYVNPFEQLSAPNKTEPDTAKDITDISHPAPQQPSADIQPESVADVLTEVAEQANKEAEQALDRVSAEKRSVSNAFAPEKEHTEANSLAEAMQEAAKDLKDELKTKEGQAMLKETMPKEMAEGFKQTVKDIARDGIADSWESADAEDSPSKSDNGATVRVYNLPMRPYVSIDVGDEGLSRTHVRDDVIVKVASFKKEFDQVDRTLASCTANYIVYGIAKGGGFRVIRQHDGSNKQVFKKGDNRMFNVCISETPSKPDSVTSPPVASILATGVNGSVYWTSVSAEKTEVFEDELEQRGFIFPPLPSQDDNVTTHQLKTRAKLSSKHPEYFAISRGKSIYVIWPSIAENSRYTDQTTRIVNSEKYISEHTLKIATAKAGKDFAFSADDTVIVSLDKAGRLKFWDIREHVQPDHSGRVPKQAPVEIKTPALTLNVAPVSEKSWPTSVMFVDKERATQKNVALRYLLVGMRQNHTIQLWDLGLGRAVQELNFPQDAETDPICSLVYHPKSSMIVFGHPKRNSVFFIHLSVPRYNLPSMPQREYIRCLADKDPKLPMPESTAIMSGIREVGLASIGGELRSLDVMSPVNKLDPEDEEEAVLEVYIMHSRGVAYLNLKKRDLGWSSDGKVIQPLDAEVEGVIKVKQLQQAPLPAEEGSTSSGPHVVNNQSEKPTLKSSPQPVPTNGEHNKSEKKKAPKKKDNGDALPEKPADKTVSYANAAARASESSSVLPVGNAAMLEPGKGSTEPTFVSEAIAPPPVSIPQPAVVAPGASTLNADITSEGFAKAVSDQMDSLYKKIDDGLRVQQAAANANLDAVLRLVSSTLTENVEKNLNRIIASNIQENVVPSFTKSVGPDVERQISTAMSNQLSSLIPKELQKTLPQAVNRAMQEPETLRIVSELVSSKIASQVEKEFTTALHGTITPAFKTLAMNSAQNMTKEVERHVGEQLQHHEMQRNADSAKIQQLTTMTSQLLHTVQEMHGTQASLKQQLAEVQAQMASQSVATGPANRRSTAASQSSIPQAQPKDAEVDHITELMSTGRVEEGTIKWLQSERRNELFELIFIRCNPNYLRDVSQLVALSVAAAVTSSFDSHIAERLNWLEVIFGSIDIRNPDIAGRAPSVLDFLTQRLQELYMQISEIEPRNNVLGKIHALVRQAKELKAAAG